MFMSYMEPTAHEMALRMDLVERFTKLIASFKINATVRPVGSYVTGLYLPTSDIDMVLTFETGTTGSYGLMSMPSSYSKYELSSVLSKIQASGFATKVDNVLQASVPLIRITDKKTGLEIDLTAADTHGVKATEAVLKWTKEDGELVKALIAVVKMFLGIRKCGTTYTGGINSYVLVWMVVAWVHLEWPAVKEKARQMSTMDDNDLSGLTSALQVLSVHNTTINSGRAPHRATGVAGTSTARPVRLQMPEDFGNALKAFLKFYGESFDYYTRAIKIEPKPAYQIKTYRYSRYPRTQQYLLSITDPVDSSIDMGEKAYAIKHVQASFKEAYKTISRLEKVPPREYAGLGVLGIVLEADFTDFMAKRKRFSQSKLRV